MILVLTGQERFPFDRLLAMVDEGIGRGIIHGPVLAQTGSSRYVSRYMEGRPFFPPERLETIVRESERIISHAGVGSILMSLNARKIPIIVPRRSTFKEHVDDHQVELAARLEEIGRARVAHDAQDLYKIFQTPPGRIPRPSRNDRTAGCSTLIQCLSSIIAELAAKGG